MPSGATQSVLHKKLVADVAKYVRSRGGYAHKIFGGAFGAAGQPDFYCGIPLENFAKFPPALVCIECKSSKTAKLNPAQLKVKVALEQARIVYIVAHSVEELEEALIAARIITTRTLQRKLITEVG